MPGINDITERVITHRLMARAVELGRPGIVSAATYSAQLIDENLVTVAKNDGRSDDDFAEACAILSATIAEGSHRLKTELELWGELASKPATAQEAWSRAVAVVVGRRLMLSDWNAADEIASLAAWILSQSDPSTYQTMAAANQLGFDPTTTEAAS